MQGFFQFNNSIINETFNFVTSSFDLLFLSGPKGSSKSESIEKVSQDLKENHLVFSHFCFKNTTIDDFLLNFYDSLRNFSYAQKISLKKLSDTSFKEKVSHYFKAIEADCIIIVENFENVEENVEIIDFLSHLASYPNVKIIILTRNAQKNLFRFKKIKMMQLNVDKMDKDRFKSQLSFLDKVYDEETKEKFYNIAQGFELYLKMSVKYCQSANIELYDLIDEYERKNKNNILSYEEFIVSKFFSIVPSVYRDFLRTLSVLEHPVSIDFIENYKLGNINYINYLRDNFLVSFFQSNQVYIKDYFRKYILDDFSIQQKVNYYTKFVEIFETELTKSPKDRLIRLSRESIRKEIEHFNSQIPLINSTNNQNFSYIGLSNKPLEDEKTLQKLKLADKLKKIKERKEFVTSNKAIRNISLNLEKEKRNSQIVDLINQAKDLSKKYEYVSVLQKLQEALITDIENEFKIEILMMLAQTNELLNEFEESKKYYNQALALAKIKNDKRRYEIEFLIALNDKHSFKIENAKEKFLLIANDLNAPNNYVAKSYIELGEIEQANLNQNGAIKYYNNALDLIKGKNTALECKCYYRLANLYDENQDYQNAIKYYQKNYQTPCLEDENKYYSISLTNLALIKEEQNEIKEAIEYLKLALIYDSEKNDFENMYFSQKELAKLYSNIDELTSISYFKQAFDSAQKFDDTFKKALVYFELGEFYYDKQNDKKALENFLGAKVVLKDAKDDENIQRINSRINDIKVRLEGKDFSEIMEKYDQR